MTVTNRAGRRVPVVAQKMWSRIVTLVDMGALRVGLADGPGSNAFLAESSSLILVNNYAAS